MNDALRQMIIASAGKLGISPVDLATVISYETAGTFDPLKAGPTTQWGQHKGLIQWGGPQAQKYLGGDFSIPRQGEGIVAYMQDAGVKPGMGLLDVYSAVNAGRVGRYNASDANNGGAPGTVRDKVEDQMAGHRRKAEALINASLPGPEQEIGGDSLVPRSFPGLGPATTFGSMAPAMAGPAVAAGPKLEPPITDLSGADLSGIGAEKITPGERIGKFLSGIEVMPAPRPSPHPGGPTPAQANALTKVLNSPTIADLLLKKRLPYG